MAKADGAATARRQGQRKEKVVATIDGKVRSYHVPRRGKKTTTLNTAFVNSTNDYEG